MLLSHLLSSLTMLFLPTVVYTVSKGHSPLLQKLYKKNRWHSSSLITALVSVSLQLSKALQVPE